MELLLDIGNSNLKWSLSEGGSLGPVSTWPHYERGVKGLETLWDSLERPERIRVASVAGFDREMGILNLSTRLWQLKPTFVRTRAQALGVTLAYSKPEKFGVDRWLALIAVFNQYPCPALVVDCGTAVTLDALDANGQHLGGLIIPGLHMMWDSLFHNTHIPAAAYREHDAPFGQDTGECVVAGAQQAVAGAIERAQQYLHAIWGLPPNLILCGSDGPKLARLLNQEAIYVQDLVLQGLVLLEE